MKRKVLSVMLAAAMTATVFAGCGSTAEEPAGTSDGAAGTETGGIRRQRLREKDLSIC